MRWVLLLLMLTVIVGCAADTPTPTPSDRNGKDLAVVDEYLQALALVVKLPTAEDVKKAHPALERQRPAFEESLARLLEADDPRAPSRLVFSQTVQIGAYLEAETRLGKAAGALLGRDFPTVIDGDHKLYAPSDLYLWWTNHSSRYEPFPLLQQWEASSIAQKTVIPMYRELAEIRSKRPELSPSSP